VVLGKDALQAGSQVPVVDLVETLQDVTAQHVTRTLYDMS
jgi:hypothetical protein